MEHSGPAVATGCGLELCRQLLPAGHRRATLTWGKLIRQSTDRHAPLVQAAGADNIIRRDGYIEVHRTSARMDKARVTAKRFMEEFGVEAKLMDGKALRALEPAIKIEVEGATHWADAWTCSDPGGLVAAYAALFERQGGRIVNADAGDLQRAGSGWRVGMKPPNTQSSRLAPGRRCCCNASA
ncbi:NAD(P)/FAD-dependent oxidoreductase [Paracoccus aerius]